MMSDFTHDSQVLRNDSSETPWSTQVLARLLEAIPDYAVLTVDACGRFSCWNVSSQRMFGYSEQEILGRDFEVLCPPAAGSRPEFERGMSGLGDQDRVELELLLGRREGGEFAARVVLAPLISAPAGAADTVVVVHDLTWKQHRLREVRDQKQRLRSVVETAVDAIIIIDDRGLIDSVNPGTERMFGYAPEELLGRNVSLLMPESFSSEHDSYIRNYLRTGHARIIGIGRTVQARRKDGTLFPADLAISAFEDGRPYFTGILRDVSERRMLEAELLHIAETEQRRIGQELHDDIQQQVTGLTLMSSHLAEALTAAAADQPGLAALQATAGRVAKGLRETNQSLRQLARGLVPLQVDSQGLTPSLAGLAARVGEFHAIDCSFSGETMRSELDGLRATHLYRIAQEAVQNALKHATAGSLAIRLFERDAMLALEIADDGVGFAPKARASGRGLQIMAYRADLIGAVLTVRRRETGGTIVCCTLPLPRLA